MFWRKEHPDHTSKYQDAQYHMPTIILDIQRPAIEVALLAEVFSG